MTRRKDPSELMREWMHEFEELEHAMSCAMTQISKHIDVFSEDELKCMAMDDVINIKWIPENKRSGDWVKMWTDGKLGKHHSERIKRARHLGWIIRKRVS